MQPGAEEVPGLFFTDKREVKMRIFTTVEEMQNYALKERRAGKTIATVPTMGFLHAGHMSLVDIARQKADILVVTIFVNPTQFGPNEDLDKYPRDFENDCRLCEGHGVDVIFAPTPEAMYAPDRSIWVDEEKLSKKLCGKTRPIHFRGVCTVVAKLFNITQCNVAVFGRKDAQQALIIRRMVRDLNFPIEIIVAPLVRAADRLALSSRNRYLSEDEHRRALVLSRSLAQAEEAIRKNGIATAAAEAEKIAQAITAEGGVVDYVTALDGDSLEELNEKSRSLLLALAAYFGNTRLIDNIYLEF